MALEELTTDETETNKHFKLVGITIGLARIVKIHTGRINDLKEKVKENVEANT